LSTIGAIVEALRSGEIVACDRVAPWDVDRLARYEGIAVHAYAAPTVHLLVPNLHKPLTAQREFRRALLYGLDRQRILRDDLLKTEDPARGHVLDGPFRTHDAAEEGAAPRTYDRRMMVALVRAAAAREIGNESAVDLAQTLPSVTLAYVPSETARVACRAIKQQLELDGRGIPVELVEVTAHDALADRSRWDLLYVEWPAFDSLADAARLLGSEGLVQGGSPWLEDLLGQLASAGSVDDARETLQRIDRLVRDELTVIPLFQITEHFARRTSLEGIEDGTVTLYQNVESWRHPPVVPK
jgi:ABC-type oligopeptide transport system substrate-binding subunit